VQVYGSDEIANKSIFGLPVFMPLQIETVRWKEGNERKATTGIYVPCCVVELAAEKIVEKTIIQNQKIKGTVKEYFAQGDYQVTIKGILSSDDNSYPMQLVKTLKEIFDAPAAIELVHELMNELGIYNVVLEGIRWLPTNGYVNLQPFEIRGVSDNPVELQLKEKENLNAL
jgi:hypothetical protein